MYPHVLSWFYAVEGTCGTLKSKNYNHVLHPFCLWKVFPLYVVKLDAPVMSFSYDRHAKINTFIMSKSLISSFIQNRFERRLHVLRVNVNIMFDTAVEVCMWQFVCQLDFGNLFVSWTYRLICIRLTRGIAWSPKTNFCNCDTVE